MRSAILLGLAIFFAVVAGGLGITWYAQASGTQKAIEQAIAKINEKQTVITYESLQTSGFPTNVIVTMHRPKFSGRLDQLLNQINEEAKNSGHPLARPLPAAKPWQEDAQLDGSIILSVNALSDHYNLQVTGNWTSTSVIDGKTFANTYTQNGATFCSLQLARTGSLLDSLWNYHSLARDADAFIHDFRMFDCAFPGSSITDTTSKSRIGGSGPARFYITNAPVNDNVHMRVYLNAADMEVTPEGDEMLTRFFRALEPNNLQPRRLSLYGKQQIDVDFTYNGPASLKDAQNPELEISLGKFNVSNAAYDTKFAFYLSNTTPPTGTRQAKLTIRGDSTFTPQYDILIHELARAVIDEAYSSADPRFMEFQASMNRYTPDQLYAIVAPAIPNFNALGHVVQSVDMEYTGAPDFASGEATLHDLELSVTSYGIKGNGKATREKDTAPAGQLSLTCNNCAAMVDDILAYATRINNVVVYFSPEQAAQMAPNPQLAEGVKRFLSELAGPDKVNLTYDIQTAQGAFTINGKPISTVTSRYYEYIAPALKQKEQRR